MVFFCSCSSNNGRFSQPDSVQALSEVIARRTIELPSVTDGTTIRQSEQTVIEGAEVTIVEEPNQTIIEEKGVTIVDQGGQIVSLGPKSVSGAIFNVCRLWVC